MGGAQLQLDALAHAGPARGACGSSALKASAASAQRPSAAAMRAASGPGAAPSGRAGCQACQRRSAAGVGSPADRARAPRCAATWARQKRSRLGDGVRVFVHEELVQAAQRRVGIAAQCIDDQPADDVQRDLDLRGRASQRASASASPASASAPVDAPGPQVRDAACSACSVARIGSSRSPHAAQRLAPVALEQRRHAGQAGPGASAASTPTRSSSEPRSSSRCITCAKRSRSVA